MSDLRSQALAWLRERGYSTELRVGRVLRERAWYVDHAVWFNDPDSGKPRELDLKATIYGSRSSENRWVGVTLAIECKRSLEKPWIVFAAPRDTLDLQIRNSTVADSFSRDILYSVRPEVGIPACLRPAAEVGHGVVRAFSDGKSNDPTAPYAALRSVLNACAALGRENEGFALSARPQHLRIDLVVPVIILDGVLFRHSLGAQDEDNVEEIPWIQSTIASSDGSTVIVTIVQLTHLAQYLDSIEADLRRWCQGMLPWIENVHSLAEQRRSPMADIHFI